MGPKVLRQRGGIREQKYPGGVLPAEIPGQSHRFRAGIRKYIPGSVLPEQQMELRQYLLGQNGDHPPQQQGQHACAHQDKNRTQNPSCPGHGIQITVANGGYGHYRVPKRVAESADGGIRVGPLHPDQRQKQQGIAKQRRDTQPWPGPVLFAVVFPHTAPSFIPARSSSGTARTLAMSNAL